MTKALHRVLCVIAQAVTAIGLSAHNPGGKVLCVDAQSNGTVLSTLAATGSRTNESSEARASVFTEASTRTRSEASVSNETHSRANESSEARNSASEAIDLDRLPRIYLHEDVETPTGDQSQAGDHSEAIDLDRLPRIYLHEDVETPAGNRSQAAGNRSQAAGNRSQAGDRFPAADTTKILIRLDTTFRTSTHHDTTKVYYRWDKWGLDTTYMGNATTVHRLDSILRLMQLDSVSLVSSASPEGSMKYNETLSRKRGETMRVHLARILDEQRLRTMTVVPLGSNYDEFLKALKEAKDIPYVDEVINEFKKNPDENPDITYRRIMKMRQGVPYSYIKRRILPYLRYAEIIIISHPRHAVVDTTVIAQPVVVPEDTIAKVGPVADTLAHNVEIAPQAVTESEPVDTVTPAVRKYWYPALKTNLLYDAVTALNAELEIPIGKKFSIAFEDVFPWWNWGPNGKKYCFQLWEMGVEPRWWFARTDKKDYLSGHFVGAYGMSGKYDFQNDTDICYQGEFWSAGLTYGYAVPICKWLNMEFSISAGYLRTDYRHYQPDEAYEHLYRDHYKIGKTSWLGPTKAKISLVLPLGRDSHNAKAKK